MSNPDPDKIIFSSRYKYLLNSSSATASVTATGASVGALSYTTATLNIPIENTEDFSQVQVTFSFDSGKYWTMPIQDLDIDANFTLTSIGKFTGSNYQMTFYIVNQTGSTQSFSTFTISARGFIFVQPT